MNRFQQHKLEVWPGYVTAVEFYEGQNLFDVTEWRYGFGGGVLWFSPFGPLQVVLGFPLDPLSIEDSPVFEFSVGGAGL